MLGRRYAVEAAAPTLNAVLVNIRFLPFFCLACFMDIIFFRSCAFYPGSNKWAFFWHCCSLPKCKCSMFAICVSKPNLFAVGCSTGKPSKNKQITPNLSRKAYVHLAHFMVCVLYSRLLSVVCMLHTARPRALLQPHWFN